VQRLLTGGQRDDQLGPGHRHLDQWLSDGGQRRADPARDRQVVEPAHAELVGDAPAGLR
jgi:hypothetical protein